MSNDKYPPNIEKIIKDAVKDEAKAYIENNAEKLIEDTVKKQIKGYRNIVIAFLLGFGGLVFVIIGSEFLGHDWPTQFIRDNILRIPASLSNQLSTRVATSYQAQFVLNQNKQSRSVLFYATKKQALEAYIQVKQIGPGDLDYVRIWVNNSSENIESGNKEWGMSKIDLIEHLNKSRMFRMPTADPNIHVLNVQIIPTAAGSNQVHVRILINVFG